MPILHGPGRAEHSSFWSDSSSDYRFPRASSSETNAKAGGKTTLSDLKGSANALSIG